MMRGCEKEKNHLMYLCRLDTSHNKPRINKLQIWTLNSPYACILLCCSYSKTKILHPKKIYDLSLSHTIYPFAHVDVNYVMMNNAIMMLTLPGQENIMFLASFTLRRLKIGKQMVNCDSVHTGNPKQVHFLSPPSKSFPYFTSSLS